MSQIINWSVKMIGSIEEPEVKIRVPRHEAIQLKKKVKTVEAANKDIQVDLLKKLNQSKSAVMLSVNEICWIRENIELGEPLHEWLGKCRVELPEPPVIPRNLELEARVQRLQREQEERDYQAMTRNVDNRRSKYPDESLASQGFLH